MGSPSASATNVGHNVLLRDRLHALERDWDMDFSRSVLLTNRERKKLDPLHLLAVRTQNVCGGYRS